MGYIYTGRFDVFTISLYAVTVVLLAISFMKSREKTLKALKKAWKAFENILPQLSSILIIIGIMLAALNPQTISMIIGAQSGWIGLAAAAAVGSITLIPGFVAFPLAAALLGSGAGLMQIAVFVSTLMMVGVVTLPLETKYFGRKAALLRNSMAFVFSFIVAVVMGVVLG